VLGLFSSLRDAPLLYIRVQNILFEKRFSQTTTTTKLSLLGYIQINRKRHAYHSPSRRVSGQLCLRLYPRHSSKKELPQTSDYMCFTTVL
jgi:hypothetical protein